MLAIFEDELQAELFKNICSDISEPVNRINITQIFLFLLNKNNKIVLLMIILKK